jgi:predicted dehydrogenase
MTAYVARHPGAVELAAVCTRTFHKANAFSAEFGFKKAYAGISDMLAQERLDACICVVPVDQIAATSIFLLQQKIPVLIEKPIGRTMRELESILAAAREAGTRHMVSLNRRHNSCLTSAVSWAKTLGPIRLIEARMMRQGRREKMFLLETGIHALDFACGLGGRVLRCQVDQQHGARDDSTWYLIDV